MRAQQAVAVGDRFAVSVGGQIEALGVFRGVCGAELRVEFLLGDVAHDLPTEIDQVMAVGGRNNRDEFIAGLDPKFPDRSNLAIVSAGPTVNFSVPTAAGPGYDGLSRRYRLRFSPDLLDWHTVVAEGIADGPPLTHSVVDAKERGFYRIEMTIE